MLLSRSCEVVPFVLFLQVVTDFWRIMPMVLVVDKLIGRQLHPQTYRALLPLNRISASCNVIPTASLAVA